MKTTLFYLFSIYRKNLIYYTLVKQPVLFDPLSRWSTLFFRLLPTLYIDSYLFFVFVGFLSNLLCTFLIKKSNLLCKKYVHYQWLTISQRIFDSPISTWLLGFIWYENKCFLENKSIFLVLWLPEFSYDSSNFAHFWVEVIFLSQPFQPLTSCHCSKWHFNIIINLSY